MTKAMMNDDPTMMKNAILVAGSGVYESDTGIARAISSTIDQLKLVTPVSTRSSEYAE